MWHLDKVVSKSDVSNWSRLSIENKPKAMKSIKVPFIVKQAEKLESCEKKDEGM